MNKRFTIAQVAQATGLEECEIHFFEQLFREFVTSIPSSPVPGEFFQEHIDLFRRAKKMIHEEGRSLDEIKGVLRTERDARAAGSLKGRRSRRHAASPAQRQARIIAVTSGKGGVGKTFITANLAVALTRAGKKVAIFDADPGPSGVHALMGVTPKLGAATTRPETLTLDDLVATGPCGIKIISGGLGLDTLGGLSSDHRHLIRRQLDLLEHEVDFLLIDTGAGINENVLRLTAFADEIIVVTTPNIVAAADAYSIIKVLLEIEPRSRLGLVVNMTLDQLHAKNVMERINTATQKHLRYALADLGFVVIDPHVEASRQVCTPLLIEYPKCDAAQRVRELAEIMLHTSVFVHGHRETAFEELLGVLRRNVVGVQ